jgi:transposase-like protein
MSTYFSSCFGSCTMGESTLVLYQWISHYQNERGKQMSLKNDVLKKQCEILVLENKLIIAQSQLAELEQELELQEQNIISTIKEWA